MDMKQFKEKTDHQRNDWTAVYALALGVAGLITAEFLPVSLLTPMAADLHITEGIAGQAISITAVVAMVAGLLSVVATKHLDRRIVLLCFSILQILSNILVAIAPDFLTLTIGRVLLGIAIGGFWSMMAATAMRLVNEKNVPKALSVIFGAVSFATVVAAPLGSFLGGLIGWRNVFFLTAAYGALVLAFQFITLPSLKNNNPAHLGTILKVLKRPGIKIGLLATMFVFIGYATFFTYLRPFLEIVTGVSVNTLSVILLGFGIANLLGTALARFLLERSLKYTLIAAPMVMGLAVGCFLLFGKITLLTALFVAFWGMAFGCVQVGWPTWLTRSVADEAESAGALQITAIQLAITTGAATGGIFYDHTGPTGVFIYSTIITIIAAVVAAAAFRKVQSGRNKSAKAGKKNSAKTLAA
jgi:predicted MFS family arabinose efflux permease